GLPEISEQPEGVGQPAEARYGAGPAGPEGKRLRGAEAAGEALPRRLRQHQGPRHQGEAALRLQLSVAGAHALMSARSLPFVIAGLVPQLSGLRRGGEYTRSSWYGLAMPSTSFGRRDHEAAGKLVDPKAKPWGDGVWSGEGEFVPRDLATPRIPWRICAFPPCRPGLRPVMTGRFNPASAATC